MVVTTHHLALFNIAHGKYPLDDARMAGFTSALDRVNALADRSAGFVWRYVNAYADGASAEPVYADPLILPNLSVWESPEAAMAYVYRGVHGGFLQARERWFREIDGPSAVAWWVPMGEQPSLAESRRRLELLAAQGPSAEAFSLREPCPVPAPESESA
ncbi:DUF3291 domain-containing protein [Actomonas aquatica]|uniref:DUF3291 domain-containing protein n=1 Tax=Actomonas aquatica TaxID=2866162 RepID=A0ABZ1C583_9BACT|nr:DUF3291 domain-containing protein [Opitutus sp. WL0086]WRQ86641.1 DUF3291 domain-containing protein [Opitutus sp. WL0086]